MKKRLTQAARYVWMLAVFGAVGVYLVHNFQDVVTQIRTVPFPRLVLTFALIIVGRLLLVRLAVNAVHTVDWHPPYRKVFRIHALSQLAKYLPGGVWHFVGQAGFYHAGGLSLPDVTRAMFIENVWLVLSAGMTGSTLLIVSIRPQQAWMVVILLGAWFAILYLLARRRDTVVRVSALLTVFLLQAAIWLVFGFSFAALLPLDLAWDIITLGAGAFVISWLIGFLIPIAPGGIGVREVALSGLMLNVLSTEQGLVLVFLHRMLWVFAEVVLGLVAWIWIRD